MGLFSKKTELPDAAYALPGRSAVMPVPAAHFVSGASLQPPFPAGTQEVVLGLGCFWGAERLFWTLPGVYTTAVGYAGGRTPNPTYEEVCSGRTGHTEAVRVIYDPARVTLPGGEGEPSVNLKIGQTLDKTRGEVKDPVGNARIVVPPENRARQQ